jgi:hypothetical protein
VRRSTYTFHHVRNLLVCLLLCHVCLHGQQGRLVDGRSLDVRCVAISREAYGVVGLLTVFVLDILGVALHSDAEVDILLDILLSIPKS